MNSYEQSKEKLFTNLSFIFNKKDKLIKIYDKNGDEVLIQSIAFLRNLLSINKDDYRVTYEDLEQYFMILSPRFGKRPRIEHTPGGVHVHGINIH